MFRKDAQFCSQVHEAIAFALSLSHQALLRDAEVESVLPAPHVGRLEVTLRGSPELVEALDRARGFIRGVVADDITRKRVPTLVFMVFPKAETSVDEAP